MGVLKLDHIGIIVEDLEAAERFFLDLGLEREGGGTVEGAWVDAVVGLDGVRNEIAMMRTPDGHGRVELIRVDDPPGDGSPEAARRTGPACAPWRSRSTTCGRLSPGCGSGGSTSSASSPTLRTFIASATSEALKGSSSCSPRASP